MSDDSLLDDGALDDSLLDDSVGSVHGRPGRINSLP